MVEGDQGVGRQVVVEALEAVVEQWQPMLHAGPAAALAYRLVEWIVARGAEGGEVALSETSHCVGVEEHFAHRQQVDRLQLTGGTLGFAVEGADRLQGVAKEIEAHRLVLAWREDVDHPTPDGEFAALRDRGGAMVTVDREMPLERLQVDVAADLG